MKKKREMAGKSGAKSHRKDGNPAGGRTIGMAGKAKGRRMNECR